MATAPDSSIRLVTGSGLSVRVGSVDVYAVGSPDQARSPAAPRVWWVTGSDLDSALAPEQVVPRVLAADVPEDDDR